MERVAEIAESTIAQLAEAAGANGLAPASVTVEALLGGIRYYRVHDHIEQVALLNLLDGIVHARPQIKLVVLDSIAFHFRYDFGDMGLRSRLLNGMSQTLIKLAHKHQLAVVLMNQMTTKVRAGDGDGQSALVPALGTTRRAGIRLRRRARSSPWLFACVACRVRRLVGPRLHHSRHPLVARHLPVRCSSGCVGGRTVLLLTWSSPSRPAQRSSQGGVPAQVTRGRPAQRFVRRHSTSADAALVRVAVAKPAPRHRGGPSRIGGRHPQCHNAAGGAGGGRR